MLNNKPDIVVSKINEALVFIDTSSGIAKELSRFFSAKAENYRFHPLYKQGKWSGDIFLFDLRNHQLPIGLCYRLKEFATKGEYTISFQFQIGQDLSKEDFLSFVESLNLPFKPYSYQLKAAYDALRYKHLNVQSCTGSGKSLIIYILIRFLEKSNIKTLLVCPKTQLVEQMFGDFYDYGWEEVEEKCCRVYGGQKRLLQKNVIISTYQSLYSDAKKGQKGEDYIDFDSINAVIIDEGHSSKCSSIKTLCIDKLVNTEYRYGFSGTYPDEGTANWLTIVGSTGRIKQYTTYQELQENDQIANIKIKMIKLNYPEHLRKQNYLLNRDNYSSEVDFINLQPERMEFIIKLLSNITGNTLVLFIKKSALGIPLYDKVKNSFPKRKVLYIDGSVPVNEREAIRRQIEASDGVILVGSFGCLSEGNNFKRLHNIIFASSYKSEIKVLQSIGRSLRLHDDKEYATLYDIVDNMKYIDKENHIWYTNATLTHGKKRYQIYQEQKFPIETLEYEIKDTTKGIHMK